MSFYSAEVITFTTDLNLNPVSSLFAVNLGGLLLQALLEFWPRTRINPMDEEENEVNHGERIVFCYIQQSEDSLCVCGGQPVSSLACVCVCVCVHSERRAGEQGAERKRIFSGPASHARHLRRSRRKNSI